MSCVNFMGIVERGGRQVAKFNGAFGQFVLDKNNLEERIKNVLAGKANPDRDASEEYRALSLLSTEDKK